MKDFFKGIFLLCFVFFSFFYTDKVIDMINDNSPLMKEIISIKSDYDVLPVNALIDGDTIVPGVSGKEINVGESYDNMKLGGVFREEMLVFEDLYPSNSMIDNKDKYIVKGNGSKKQVAVIYILNGSYINEIKLLNNITIFVNQSDITIENIEILKTKEIYTYGSNGKYSEEMLVSDNTLINRFSNNKSNYCLTKMKNNDVLEVCSDMNMYTIIPNIIGNYYEVRENLSNGSIILLNNLNEYDLICKYIKSKGYDIVFLSELLNE